MRKILIIGCGNWGRNYLRIFSGLLSVDNVVVVDTNLSIQESLRRQYPGLHVIADIGKALSDETLAMAAVVTPATTHYGLVRKCLQRGLDVLTEKPLTLDTRDAEHLAALAKRGGRILMVGHTFLYNSGIRKMRELIAAGKCGAVYYMKATRTHLGLIRPDVDAVWDLAPHDVSIFNYFLGSAPISVSAVGGCFLQRKKIDAAFINLFYPGNVLAHIHVSWADSNKERTVAVVGSRARILFDDLNALERVKIFEKGISANIQVGNSYGEFLFALRDGAIMSPKIDAPEPLAEVCKEFLRSVKTRKQPLTGPKSGVEVVRTMCAISRSLRNRGKQVAVSAQS